ncbi:EF-hand domain-containing protein [Formosa sp. 3Alg 14/1]|uniref:EF-hand domain-containing protein n=1 Tax=Formosa sp. 3Alg 14/1 TaxID=3382190 RepID=UPI0039BDEC7C
MKSNIIKTVLGIAFVSICSVQSISAQEKGDRKGPPPAAELIEKMDANEDGKLSEDEVKGPLKEHFSDIDADEDGFLTLKELEEAPKPKGKPSKD